MAPLRKWIILIHRYLGIALCLVLVTWFVSGIGMIYTGGMPSLAPEERLGRMRALDFAKVRLTAMEAADLTGLSLNPSRTLLLTITDRPAYRFGVDRPVTVFADNGELLTEISEAEGLAVASRFLEVPVSALHLRGRLERADQWTIGERRRMPLYRIAADDADHTELYVAARLGEVVMQTTRRSRSLAWMAAIPHWLYFAPLRLNDRLWTRIVLWASGIGTVAVLLGLVLAAAQYRVRYSGLLLWHYMTGVVFGLFSLTWVFSGFLSMQPGDWAESRNPNLRIQQALSGGPLDLSEYSALDETAWTALVRASLKEIEFRRLMGHPYYLVRGEGEPFLVNARPLQVQSQGFPLDDVFERIKGGYAGAPVEESLLLASYDSYYYDRTRGAPLPVLRVKFGDPEGTWVYVDPRMSEMVARFTRRQRWERWLYHGLHSLDFSFWYYDRPLWDIGVIGLCGGGAVLSGIGVVIGFRRVKRALKSVVRRRALDPSRTSS